MAGSLSLIVACFILSKDEKNKSNFSGCDGLKGNETMGDMCNHLHSEHENAEKEIRKILSLNNNDECSRKLINVWSKEINHHFGEEERVVFPAMLKKNKSFEPEIKKLLEEHKYFYKIIDEIKNKNCSNCGNLPKDFCKKLLNHIEKEEKLFNDFKK